MKFHFVEALSGTDDRLLYHVVPGKTQEQRMQCVTQLYRTPDARLALDAPVSEHTESLIVELLNLRRDEAHYMPMSLFRTSIARMLSEGRDMMRRALQDADFEEALLSFPHPRGWAMATVEDIVPSLIGEEWKRMQWVGLMQLDGRAMIADVLHAGVLQEMETVCRVA